jgi:hypothetical protein
LSILNTTLAGAHLTTLATYFLAFLLTIWLGQRKHLKRLDFAIFISGIMVFSVESFELTWIYLGHLVFPGTGGDLSTVVIDLAVLSLSMMAVYRVSNDLAINGWGLLLFLATLSLWLLWLPNFKTMSGSRLYADPLKAIQTALVVYVLGAGK